MRINAISTGINPPHDVNVIIEVPVGGEPIKYEMDKDAGTLVVDRFLYTAMRYPGNYGFIPHTLSDDGDPCDVLVPLHSDYDSLAGVSAPASFG
jgi:inorganic pyrophosphatase